MKKKTRKKITIIFFIVFGIILIFGLFLFWAPRICPVKTDSTDDINLNIKNQMYSLFTSEEDTKLTIYPPSRDFKIKQGTKDFGIAIAFAPNLSQAWGGDKNGCRYSIIPINQSNYCINNGWSNVANSILTGTNNVIFHEVDATRGYEIIKINVPEDIPPCLQRFNIKVTCTGYPSETTTSYFDVEIIKKKLFC
jgi:hypothetical protein